MYPGAPRRVVIILCVASLAAHIATAWVSDGFYTPDEHFQVLEFAGLKLHSTHPERLPWEYHAQMRSWLLPGVCYAIVRFVAGLGVESPFHQATVIRLLFSLLGWVSLMLLGLCLNRWLKGLRVRLWAFAVLALFWFVPFFHARTMSENIAASLFSIGLSLIVLGRRDHQRSVGDHLALLGAGIAWGLTFNARFQMAIVIAAALGCLLLVSRLPLRRVLLVLLGLCLTQGAVVLLDRWGYGTWCFPAIHYIQQNLQNQTQRFGVSPWWYYAVGLLKVPFGPLLIAMSVYGWLRQPRHILTWCTLPFFVLHFFVPHKELRFLFPVLPLILVFVFVALPESWRDDAAITRALGRRWVRALLVCAVLINTAGLALMAAWPARPELTLAKTLYDIDREQLELWSLGDDPTRYAGKLRFEFYYPQQLTVRHFDSADALLTTMAAHRETVLFFQTGMDLSDELKGLEQRCETLHRSFARWMTERDRFGLLKGNRTYLLLRCEPGPHS